MHTLIVSIKKVFGNKIFIYPVNDLAKHFCCLLGQDTLTQDDVDNIKSIHTDNDKPLFDFKEQPHDYGVKL